jgi:hypothetical protein
MSRQVSVCWLTATMSPHSRVIRRIPEHIENAVDELDETALSSVGNEVLGDADVVWIDQDLTEHGTIRMKLKRRHGTRAER